MLRCLPCDLTLTERLCLKRARTAQWGGVGWGLFPGGSASPAPLAPQPPGPQGPGTLPPPTAARALCPCAPAPRGLTVQRSPTWAQTWSLSPTVSPPASLPRPPLLPEAAVCWSEGRAASRTELSGPACPARPQTRPHTRPGPRVFAM